MRKLKHDHRTRKHNSPEETMKYKEHMLTTVFRVYESLLPSLQWTKGKVGPSRESQVFNKAYHGRMGFIRH